MTENEIRKLTKLTNLTKSKDSIYSAVIQLRLFMSEDVLTESDQGIQDFVSMMFEKYTDELADLYIKTLESLKETEDETSPA